MTILYPSANSGTPQCTPSTGTNYACIDEVVLDTADYNRSTANSNTVPVVAMDEFVFTDYSGSEALNGVTARAYARVNNVTVGYAKLKFHVKIGSTRYYGDEVVLSGSSTLYEYKWSLSPATTATWDKTELNAAVFGYTLTTLGTYSTTYTGAKGETYTSTDYIISYVYQFNTELDESVPGAMECACEMGLPDVSSGGEVYVKTAMECACEMGLPVCPSTIFMTTSMTCTCEMGTPSLINPTAHGVKNAIYWGDNGRPNCVLVIGKETATGNMVFGYAEDGVESERVPVLFWYASDNINSFALASAVATNLLSKLRFEIPRGEMLISPNLGQELWDVVKTTDSAANTDTSLRVRGWIKTYHREAGEFTQVLKVTNV